jgi:alkanesulfonate monooxygenase SsuD/methylene tetrahydromethanopterin reductase-like flavin-dependent oxidoreductase (luciferase family)
MAARVADIMVTASDVPEGLSVAERVKWAQARRAAAAPHHHADHTCPSTSPRAADTREHARILIRS